MRHLRGARDGQHHEAAPQQPGQRHLPLRRALGQPIPAPRRPAVRGCRSDCGLRPRTEHKISSIAQTAARMASSPCAFKIDIDKTLCSISAGRAHTATGSKWRYLPKCHVREINQNRLIAGTNPTLLISFQDERKSLMNTLIGSGGLKSLTFLAKLPTICAKTGDGLMPFSEVKMMKLRESLIIES